MPRRDFNHEITNGKNGGLCYLNLGLRASRNQSPKRLIERASAISVAAGKNKIHYSPENINSCPIRISVPKLGFIGGAPTPKKLKVASATIASARLIVAMTKTGLSTFDKICLVIIAIGERPTSRAAWVYSLFFRPRLPRAQHVRIAPNR